MSVLPVPGSIVTFTCPDEFPIPFARGVATGSGTQDPFTGRYWLEVYAISCDDTAVVPLDNVVDVRPPSTHRHRPAP
ncbi:MAG TPA: hypothetical protein VGD67_26420 [Pseudonocardiaceae bacterium]